MGIGHATKPTTGHSAANHSSTGPILLARCCGRRATASMAAEVTGHARRCNRRQRTLAVCLNDLPRYSIPSALRPAALAGDDDAIRGLLGPAADTAIGGCGSAIGGRAIQQTGPRLAATAASIEWTTLKSTAAGLRYRMHPLPTSRPPAVHDEHRGHQRASRTRRYSASGWPRRSRRCRHGCRRASRSSWTRQSPPAGSGTYRASRSEPRAVPQAPWPDSYRRRQASLRTIPS